MKTKHKTKSKTKDEIALLKQVAFLQSRILETEKRSYDTGHIDGVKSAQRSQDLQRVEVATKFVSAVGQSLQQFTNMLHDDGVVCWLVKGARH